MAKQRIVAELGRPETADETAARKAAASQRYRSSKTFRNLVAAMLVCVAIVAVVYLGVPRGTPEEPAAVDVDTAAASAAEAVGHAVLVPEAPEGWRVNSARIEGGVWRVVYAPASGFVRVSQALSVEDDWAAQELGGFAPTGTITIDGIEWDEYDLAAPVDNISYAIATDAGPDTIMISGAATAEQVESVADGLGDQIQALRKDTP
ncbi:DUF4245 family protein [Microbacterium dauci]|uniref:DUF4245 family protein n=1 Tax=Microbacterium dauci TaxID=3048008 RepID=A0ABT6ZBV6_9MICO|nr:DUF4245 family protein [Microbacterium sp. LX3-4]MDJ1113428.1 DUF4245 family protein [Microbacterium sp. LX3-4]